MFKHFIISLVAVIAFAIFEYVHNKATYSIKTAWVKYVAGLILGTFGFSYLTKWGLFQDVEQAAFVVTFLFFFWVIVNKLKIKGVPGQAAKVIPFVLIMAAMASCQPYGNKIKDNPYPSITGVFRPLDAATLDSAAKGWVKIDSAHAGNPLIFPMKVKVEASWTQKWAIAAHEGSNITCFILWGLGILCIALSFIGGWKWDKGPFWVVGLAVGGIVLFWFGASYIDWAITKEIEVPKSLFDTPGALKAYWDANLFK